MNDLGREQLRIEVPRARLLGIRLTRRRVAVGVLVCAGAVVAGVAIGERTLTAAGIAGLIITLLFGLLGWMSYISWSRGARSFTVHDLALVVDVAGETDVLRFAKISACHVIGNTFLQVHCDGVSHQYAILHVPPRQVEQLVAAVTTRSLLTDR